MKKVFALVLAMVMVMASGLAMAAEKTSTSSFDSGDTLVVSANYSATDNVKVTISWGTVADISYTWNDTNHEWNTINPIDVTFTVANHGFLAKNVTLAAEVDGGSASMITSAIFDKVGAQPVNGATTSGAGTGTWKLTLTPAAPTGIISQIPATATVTVTIQ